VKLRCFLAEIRGPVSLRSIADAAEMNPGELSRIESGRALARDEDVPALERAYGKSVAEWYPAPVLLAMEFDEEWLEALRERMHTAWRTS
jgi:transcriptional regulator with XRE-family HTH domain